MATDKETKMYETAIAKVADLEKELETANTVKQEDDLGSRLTKALERLDTLEKRSKPTPGYTPLHKEEEEEDGNQCPQCGHELTDFGNGTYHCDGCGDYFEEE